MSRLSLAEPGAGGGGSPCPPGGGPWCSVARARLSALVTESSVLPRIWAASPAVNPRTSRKISTARWRGGRRCTAAMNASEIDSRASYRASAGGLGRGGPPRGWHSPAPARGSPRVQAAGGDHPVQPSAERGAPLETGQALPGRQQRILQRVLGVVDRTQEPV